MTRWALITTSVLLLGVQPGFGQTSNYLGFDRNEYPGDSNLKVLHQTFSYAGYWLNRPPGASTNSWVGHRAAVESAGFGFLVLFNGRLYAELKTVANAKKLGQSDALKAAASARHEGFPRDTIIFLDQEQGGRMLPEQKAYIYAWVDGIIAAGFRAGIYCSGIPNADDGNVITAEDIRQSAGGRQLAYWAINDACPPAPGCTFAAPADPRSERGELCRRLAVCAIPSAQRRGRALHKLQSRRELLSARNSCRSKVACRRERGDITGSLKRQIALTCEEMTFSAFQTFSR